MLAREHRERLVLMRQGSDDDRADQPMTRTSRRHFIIILNKSKIKKNNNNHKPLSEIGLIVQIVLKSVSNKIRKYFLFYFYTLSHCGKLKS